MKFLELLLTNGHVLWSAKQFSMQTWQKVWWPSQSRRITFLPVLTFSMHIGHWSPVNDSSVWNILNCWILWEENPCCSSSYCTLKSISGGLKSITCWKNSSRKFTTFSFSSAFNWSSSFDNGKRKNSGKLLCRRSFELASIISFSKFSLFASSISWSSYHEYVLASSLSIISCHASYCCSSILFYF